MSCRNSPSGSLATTYIARRYNLHDAQCTSLYHALRREARTQSLTVTPQQYDQAINHMENVILTSPEWTPGLLRRARERISRARHAGYPSVSTEAWVLAQIDARAATAADNLRRFLTAQQVSHNISLEQMKTEFDRLYQSANNASSMALLPSLWFPDEGTRYAVRTILTGNRCVLCGQFLPAEESHICPTNIALPHIPPVSPVSSRPQPVRQPIRRVTPRPATPLPVRRSRRTEPTPESFPLTESWANDMDAFQNVYDKMKTRLDNGEKFAPTFPEMEAIHGAITGGLAVLNTGMTFGLEMEIDFPQDEYPYTARQELARRLYDEGIALTPQVNRWHYLGEEEASRPGGEFQHTPNGWSCEFDRTVDNADGERGVEIKSQILHDEPQTWRNINRICAIAKELGGVPTPRCGLHVNVGAQGFPANNPTNHTNLVRLAQAYDDTLTRLAHNPQSGPFHRGRRYCNPNMLPPEGFTTVEEARVWATHYQAFNMQHLPSRSNPATSTSRIEVRLFDSSLDPGRIQAQTAITLGLIHAARTATPPQQQAELIGTHRHTYGTRRLSGAQWENSTSSLRQLVDILSQQGLNTAEHKEMITWLFVSGKWSPQENRNEYADED